MTPGANGLLVYEAQVGRHAQLFTVRPDGGGVHRLTNFSDSDAVWAAWSPDGKRIAFERDFSDHAGVYTMNRDGSSLRALTTNGLTGRPSWSPDGKQVVYSRLELGKRASIWLMSSDGHSPRLLTKATLPARNDPCRCLGLSSPTFSPDGKRIAFTWTKGAHSGAIFTISLSGQDLKQITSWKDGVADKIGWSPDGTMIAYSSPEFGRAGVSSNVFMIATDGSRRRLTNAEGGTINNGFDSWSPDGKKIAFASNSNGAYELYTMNRDGSGVTQVTRGPAAHHAAWGSAPA